MLVAEVAYKEEDEEDDTDEATTGIGGCGGGGMESEGVVEEKPVEGGGGSSGEETNVTGLSLELQPCGEFKLIVASLCLYFNISARTALSSAVRDWICCCNAKIAPVHPYTGSLSLKFASYTRLFAASALWVSGTSCYFYTSSSLIQPSISHIQK